MTSSGYDVAIIGTGRVGLALALAFADRGLRVLGVRLGSLSGKSVAVLGLAFKTATDDERDSLAHKLIRLLERELADVAIHDPWVSRLPGLRGGETRRL
ncbi:MAG: UDP binding domain-containing protein [Solirubrobacteraceae bacterium]